MNLTFATADCASRINHSRGVKSKLYLKFIEGSKVGLLHASRGCLTDKLDKAISQILKALSETGIKSTRSELILKLRKFDDKYPFVDGLFVVPDALGYLLFAPPEMDAQSAESFMIHELDLVPFFRAHRDSDYAPLLVGPVLPRLPEFPNSVAFIWSEKSGINPVLHGH